MVGHQLPSTFNITGGVWVLRNPSICSVNLAWTRTWLHTQLFESRLHGNFNIHAYYEPGLKLFALICNKK